MHALQPLLQRRGLGGGQVVRACGLWAVGKGPGAFTVSRHMHGTGVHGRRGKCWSSLLLPAGEDK